jgi:hypothetical protein
MAFGEENSVSPSSRRGGAAMMMIVDRKRKNSLTKDFAFCFRDDSSRF